tara:strand:+ start:714 stop:1262 length:549 start_codon:yes stop_codon:yes gene_type:complete
MLIHPSHSRKDIIEVCEVFNLEIEDMYDIPKAKLVAEVVLILSLVDFIEPEDELYFVQDIDELIEYLTEPNQEKLLTITQREKIIQDARDLVFYCKNGFQILPKFTNIEEVKSTALSIQPHGDISTVRRALSLLKEDNKIKPPIEPHMSKKVQKLLDRKEIIRQSHIVKFTSSRGRVLVEFD